MPVDREKQKQTLKYAIELVIKKVNLLNNRIKFNIYKYILKNKNVYHKNFN